MGEQMNRYLRKIKKNYIDLYSNSDFRDQWVFRELKKIDKGCIILDAGCGEQKYKKYCDHLEYKSQDFAQYDGKGDGTGLQNTGWSYKKIDYIGDIWNINEKDGYFDVILCTEVMEHIMQPNQAIKELSRLLKKDGVLILSAPFCSIPHMSPYYYYNGFSKYWYQKNAKDNGLKILSINKNGSPNQYVNQEVYRLASGNFTKLIAKIVILIMGIFFKKNAHYDLHFGYQVVLKKG
jgi:SAM-dependent methyltransferase